MKCQLKKFDVTPILELADVESRAIIFTMVNEAALISQCFENTVKDING